jgi:hypothetical protein
MSDLNALQVVVGAFRDTIVENAHEYPDVVGLQIAIAKNPTGEWIFNLQVATSETFTTFQELPDDKTGIPNFDVPMAHPEGPTPFKLGESEFKREEEEDTPTPPPIGEPIVFPED